MHVCAPEIAARRNAFGVDGVSCETGHLQGSGQLSLVNVLGCRGVYGSRAPLKKKAHFDWTDLRITR